MNMDFLKNIPVRETSHIYQNAANPGETIIALQFTDHDNEALLELVPGYIVRNTDGVTGEPFLCVYRSYLDKVMNTNVVIINKGNWVIQRMNKEFYICGDDEFQRKFEKVKTETFNPEKPIEKLPIEDRMKILEREMYRNRDIMQDFIRAVNKMADVLKDTSGALKELRTALKDSTKVMKKS